jgi:hypothetical protein
VVKAVLGTIGCALLLVGCGGTKKATTLTAQPVTTALTSTSTTTTAAPPTTTTATGPSALQAEATAKAAGDIPDSQMFLVFTNATAGYSMKYPEGWAQAGNGDHVTIRDKNNIVRIEVQPGALPSLAKVKSDLAGTQLISGPKKITIGGKPAIKVTYSTQSPPNPVTGKRVTLDVDRYYLSNGSKVAIVDLGSPHGVDNVDAYRMMIESFRWK